MNGSLRCLLTAVSMGLSCSVSSCGPSGQASKDLGAEEVGAAGLQLQVAPGVQLNSLSYSISGPGGFSRSGTVDVSASTTLSMVVGSLPAGSGFTVTLDATTTDGTTHCGGSASFAVTAHATTAVVVHLTCHEAPRTGSVLANGTLNVCPVADGIVANPADVVIGGMIALSGPAHDTDGGPSPLSYQWTASSGTLAGAIGASPTFTCTTAGPAILTLAVSDGDCADTLSTTVTCTGVAKVRINEVESTGGVPGDWTELYNAGASPADISGWKFKDNDDSHAFYVLPAGTIVPAGGFYVMEVAQFGFGLGGNDSARLFDPSGNLVDSYSWTVDAATTYGRCPDGTGAFVTTASVTKGSANACGGGTGGAGGASGTGGATGTGGAVGSGGTTGSGGALSSGGSVGSGGAVSSGGASGTGGSSSGSSPIVINEIESNGGTPDDWVELTNAGTTAVDISGWKILDNQDTHPFFVIPAGVVVPPGGFYVGDVAPIFGLGAADAVRLFDASGTTLADSHLVDSYSWTAHATTTYGRCPDGTGAFATTASSTKGTANDCGGGSGGSGGATGSGGSTGSGGVTGTGGGGASSSLPWPGTDAVVTVDEANTFGTNLSGLDYQPATSSLPAVMWAIQNGPSKLYRLLFNGTSWVSDTAGNWTGGKLLHYPGGLGAPDSEGVSKGEWADSAIYVSTERDNNNNGVSRLSILRFDTNDGGAELSATNDWNVTADLPVVGPNLGLEAITYVPDTALVAGGFFDEATHAPYNPSTYANHGTGLFFVGLEGNGSIYAYALDHVTNGFTRVATLASGQVSIMDLAYDREVGYLWGYCDNTCGNKATVFRIDTAVSSPTVGHFRVGRVFDHPTTLPDSNNEGITFAPEAECSAGQKNFFWSDDDQINGHAVRRGTIPCGTFF
ncbi:MAG TPA: lamin tail domain-containing protein [Polyangiaceae bacterium]